MLVPFGTRVVDAEGKPVGTVRHVVLDSENRQATGLVLHQGVMRSRELIVPVHSIASAGPPVRLKLPASELESLPLFHGEALRPMPDQWEMPAGFNDRALFLVGGSGWTEAALPFMKTSPGVSGTPAYVRDEDSARDAAEPDIAAGMPVYDSSDRRVGDVESVAMDPVSDKITWIVVRRGHLFAREATIPASLIKSVTDRITLNAPAQTIRRLEPA